jgi:predicted RNA binding protein YcfA (HicA-like mRNA interferase family)
MSAAAMRKYLQARGFHAISQRGSHVKMTNGSDTAIIPMHKGDLPTGTMRGILADAGLDVEDAKKWTGRE